MTAQPSPPNQSLKRVDGPPKVTGQATYAAEHELQDVAHAALILTPLTAGRLKRLDVSEVEAAPGVLLVMTARQHAPTLKPVEQGFNKSPLGTTQLALQDAHQVTRRGQIAALVVAETLEQARAAAALARFETEEAPFQVTLQGALASGEASRQQELPDAAKERGDPEGALATAEVQLEATYTTPAQHHTAMELHSTLAHWQGDELHLYEPTQWLLGIRSALQQTMGIPQDKIHVISPLIGGGFGSKSPTWPHVPLVVEAARTLSRPVKLELDRAQVFNSTGARSATRQNYKLGAGQDGRLQSLILTAESQTSMPTGDAFAESVGEVPVMLYTVANYRQSQTLLRTNTIAATNMRAPGAAPGSFGLECAMDELAVTLSLDPQELRLRNYAETDPSSGKPYSSKALRECYRLGAERFGWSRRSSSPGSMREGRELIGWGMASGAYPVSASAATARVRAHANGDVDVEVGTHEMGQGVTNVATVAAAEALSVRPECVHVKLGDSQLPPNSVSGGSRTTVAVGSAVQLAAQGLLETLGARPGEDPAAALKRQSRAQAECYREFIPQGGDPSLVQEFTQGKIGGVEPTGTDHARFSFGAHFAEVRVDAELGTVRVSRMVGAFDIGRVMSPVTARSQLLGGMVWGISMALFEESQSDPARGFILNSNLADYLLPVNADIPALEVHLVGQPDLQADPIGAKGAGELGVVGSAAAIANAVYHATGRRIRDLPIRLEQLL